MNTTYLSRKNFLSLFMISALSACGGGGGGAGSGGGGGGGNTPDPTNAPTPTPDMSGNPTPTPTPAVVIDPTPPPAEKITLTAEVKGINGGELNLANNASESRAVNSPSTVTFVIDRGQSFDITVEANPLEQLCQVINGSGSNLEEDRSDIEISCTSVLDAASCEGNADSDQDSLSDCRELEVYGTNPWIADTDGDSFSDGREAADFDPQNDRFLFNPLIADMATIAVDLTSVPSVDLDFSEGGANSRSLQTSYEQSETDSIQRNWGGETSRQLEVGHTLSVETTQTVGTEVNVSLTDIGASASYETSLSVGFEQSASQTRGSSVNWSRAATQENTRVYGETLDLTEEQNYSYDGGFLEVTARVRNNGHIPYDLENLTLSAVLFDPARPFDIEPVGTMTFSDGGFPATTILPGESAPLNFRTDITLGKAQRLLRESKNIVVMPGTFRLLDINNQSALLVDRDVSARTATIVIDYGIDAAREDKYRVAINKGNGNKSINLQDALDSIMGLDIMQGAGQWTYGNDDNASTTPEGLISIGAYSMSNVTNRYWLVAHNRNNSQGSGDRQTDYYNLLQAAYDLSNITLRAGDNVSLVYVGDRDRDGISDRMERELGTDRDLLDSDEDTLGDGLELYGWLTNLGEAPCDVGDSLKRVYSNPLSADSDEDGIDDASEKDNCENPSFNFVADAGDDQFVNRNAMVTLNGAISGATNSPPTYRWFLISGPDVVDANGDTVRELEGRRPTFTAPNEVSSLVWELAVVIDGVTQTERSVVQVQKDRQRSIYVGNYEGTSSDGTIDAPYRTLSEALNNLGPDEDLYVQTQETPYSLVNTLQLPDGSSMFGGYDENWIRDPQNNRTPLVLNTSISAAAVGVTSVSTDMWFSGFSVTSNAINSEPDQDVVAFKVAAASAGSAFLHINNNRFEASDVGSGTSVNPGSSYALQISGLSGLRLNNNILIAGQGGAGTAGISGKNGRVGGDASGQSGGSGHGGGNGGRGGNGGSTFVGAKSGGKGGDVGTVTGGSGGGAGGGCWVTAASVGKTGKPGVTGRDGSGASQTLYEDLVAGYLIASGTSGTNGDDGSGGGGGGGGSACGTASGGRGGAGGEGGELGTRGTAGAGGGASIGLWLHDVKIAELRGNTISSKNGGNAGYGGRGGNGGSGGRYSGGAAGKEVCVLFACDRGAGGARGGSGGKGGRGGHGGGGAAGPSFGIFVTANVAPLLFDNTISAGNGGLGGWSYMNGGDGGDSFAVYDADIADGSLPEIDASNTLSTGNAGKGGRTYSTSGSAGVDGWSGETNF